MGQRPAVIRLSQHALSLKQMISFNKTAGLPSEKAVKFRYGPRINFDFCCEYIGMYEYL